MYVRKDTAKCACAECPSVPPVGEPPYKTCVTVLRYLKSSRRKWGTGQGGEKRGRVSGVLSAPSPLFAQEDP
eukprot:367672-Prorocentrum_minimum.AAC.1